MKTAYLTHPSSLKHNMGALFQRLRLFLCVVVVEKKICHNVEMALIMMVMEKWIIQSIQGVQVLMTTMKKILNQNM